MGGTQSSVPPATASQSMPGVVQSGVSPEGSSPLPQELYDLIIDIVASFEQKRERIQTLKNCALTCKAWVPRTQHNLFRRVELAGGGAVVLKKLMRTLAGASHLCRLIREIDAAIPGHNSELYLPPPMQQTIEILPDLFRNHVYELRTLRLSGYHRSGRPFTLSGSFFTSLMRLRALTTLRLHAIPFRQFGDLGQIITALAALRTLDCEAIRWQEDRQYQFSPEYQRACAISRLRIVRSGSGVADSVHTRDVGLLLAAIALSLEELVINACDLVQLPIATPQLLPLLPSLRTLHISWVFPRNTEACRRDAMRALGGTGHAQLETLSLHVSGDPHELTDELHALGRELDRTLEGGAFPALRELSFHLGPAPWALAPVWWLNVLREAFPRTYSRGLVRVRGTRRDPAYKQYVPQELVFTAEGAKVAEEPSVPW